MYNIAIYELLKRFDNCVKNNLGKQVIILKKRK